MFICLFTNENADQFHGIGANPDAAYNAGDFAANDVTPMECQFYETVYDKPSAIRVIPEQIVLI